ncbi:microtubule cross-linking factor 1 isoform X4 [Arapaima gigas]
MMDSGAVKERNPPPRRTPLPAKAPGCAPRSPVAPRGRLSVRPEKDPVRAQSGADKAGSGAAAQHVPSDQKVSDTPADTCQHARVCRGRAGRPAALVPAAPMCVRTGVCLGIGSRTDSSSDLSDCPSEPQSRERRPVRPQNELAAPGARDPPGCATPTEARSQGHCSRERLPAGRHSPGRLAGQSRGPAGDLLREIEELRSENACLKDEVEELRAEMEEVRDGYLAEEVQQVQELRRELDRANKECCILQYRLRKAERRSLQVTHTGRMDGAPVHSLEQDLKIAKDVTVRLHNELKSTEERCSRAQDENEMLRQKVVEVEMVKEALQNDLERARGVSTECPTLVFLFSLPFCIPFPQEDSAELRCQLQFVQEESSVMRRRIAGLAREKDELEQELQKYKCAYGDVDCTLPLGDCTGGPHTTREAELRLRLKLVEEEANFLGRKIVELELENRDLRAENKDILSLYEQDCSRRGSTGSYGDGIESKAEIRRHLRLMEEEAALLRCSIAETEGRNKQLTTELSRISAGSLREEQPMASNMTLESNPAVLLQEELRAAHSYIGELIGKVKKLQYDNHMLTASVQHCSSASHLGPNDVTAETCSGKGGGEAEEEGGSAQLQPKREGPVGGESNSVNVLEKMCKVAHGKIVFGEEDNAEILSSFKQEAERLGKALDRLITDTHCLVYEGQLVVTSKVAARGSLLKDRESAEGQSEPFELNAINTRMRTFRTELQNFVKKLEHLGTGVPPGCPGTIHSEANSCLSEGLPTPHDSLDLPILEQDIITKFRLQGALSTRSCKEHTSQTRDGDCSSYSPSGRSGSDAWASVGGRSEASWNLRTSENLLLEALCLDPLQENGPSFPVRPDSDPSSSLQETLKETKSRRQRPQLKKENTHGGNLLRVKSVCSMSDFQRLMDSSPFLPDMDASACQLGDDTPPLSPDDLEYIEEFETKGSDPPSIQGGNNGHMDVTADGPWLGVCSLGAAASVTSTQPMRNWSDDMTETASPVGAAICGELAVRRYKDQACQTDVSRMTQTSWGLSLGLQPEPTRNTAANPDKSLMARGGPSPMSSPCRSIRRLLRTPASQSRFERPCCPSLPQRRGVEQASGRTAAMLAPRGTSESAWARSTTTRDSPVLAATWDGLSSLFSVIGHQGTTHPQPMSPSTRPHGAHGTQTACRNARERPHSPQHLITESQEVQLQEGAGVRPSHKQVEAPSRIPNKKLRPERGREDTRTPSRTPGRPHKDGQQGASETHAATSMAPWRH